MGPPSPATGAQRLHPLTVLFEFGRVLGRMASAIVILLAARIFGGRSEWGELALIALGGVGIAVAAARYLTLRYVLEGDTLVIRSGILFRQLRSVPLDRVQNVDLRQTLLQRLGRVVDLRIETAAGEGSEVRLSLLSEAAARRLAATVAAHAPARVQEAALEGARDADGPPREAEAGLPARPEPLYRASSLALALMGATRSRAGAVLGGLFGLYVLAGQVAGERAEIFGHAARRAVELPGTTVALYALGALVLLVSAGWLLSIGGTLVRYHGFTLREETRGRLTRRYGLTTQHESVIPLGRIQALRIEANAPRRALGFWTVFVATAGSREDDDSGGTSMLCPLIPAAELGPLAQRVFAGLDLERTDWQPVSRHTVRRGFIRAALLAALLVLALARPLGPPALLALAPLLALGYGWAELRWRALAYASREGLLLARAGVWKRSIVVVPEGKIQSLSIVASPFQRRLGIASLTVATAASGNESVAVVDLPAGLALELQDALSAGAARAGAWLPDGV